MRKWSFDLCYMVTLNDREWEKPLAMFVDLYEALTYARSFGTCDEARTLSREGTGKGLYEVHRVRGDETEVIYTC